MRSKITKALKYPEGSIEYPLTYAKDNDYYYCTFLKELAKESKYVLEIGSYIGISSRHIAEGLPDDGLLICVDNCVSVNSEVFHKIEDYKSNIKCIERHSGEAYPEVKKALGENKLDILFIDATHQFNFAYPEYLRYRPLVKEGGLIIWDDLKVHPQMEYIWDNLKEKKTREDRLHWTGFGWCVKDKSVPYTYDELLPNCP